MNFSRARSTINVEDARSTINIENWSVIHVKYLFILFYLTCYILFLKFFFLVSFLGNINLLLLYSLHTTGTCAIKMDSLPDIYCFFSSSFMMIISIVNFENICII